MITAAATRETANANAANAGYLPPRIVRLGTLAELTKGGTVGPDDGLGGAGDGGSL